MRAPLESRQFEFLSYLATATPLALIGMFLQASGATTLITVSVIVILAILIRTSVRLFQLRAWERERIAESLESRINDLEVRCKACEQEDERISADLEETRKQLSDLNTKSTHKKSVSAAGI